MKDAEFLKQQGYDVIGVTMQIWQDEDIASQEENGGCCGLSAVDDARRVANHLGIPFYDNSKEQMYLLFGDTFKGINNTVNIDGWRSQTVGISTDFNLEDGLTFDSFISDEDGKAIQIIPSKHDSNKAGGEKTCIPTGGIEIDGVHYIFYMSIRKWNDDGSWDINFCTVAKSTDAQNYEVLTDLYWAEGSEKGNRNILRILGQEDATNHIASNFLQIFPYRVDDYIYLFGLTAGRFGGCKLGRVKVENIESFEEYEYYVGKDSLNNPIWLKGIEGLEALEGNDDSYIVEPQVGELSVCYNAYLKKYVMSFYSENKIIMRLSDDLISWSDYEVITTANEFIQLYGGFSHELYMEENGKIMYFIISQYENESLGNEGYNVRLLKVTFE